MRLPAELVELALVAAVVFEYIVDDDIAWQLDVLL